MSECYTAWRIQEGWGSHEWKEQLFVEHLTICAICQANQNESGTDNNALSTADLNTDERISA